ncbi:TetR/AcrR family transcriptional regulator [Solimicrobium silvestre]|uniref:WHG domain n=1 Tax=Solimicrobium silvestre TaxID=2099400 RepID=A0A2S9H169_9BURK|nr:TetR/AcrR family transcriptional regulator [Solimicrobium silvestre]PRC93732.1 WHG domain [Solimicrobium silvestre]
MNATKNKLINPKVTPDPVDFKQEQQVLRSTIRQAMLAAANQLLSEEGLPGFTLRRVADAVNCSTTLLYSQFGGKDGLSNELYLEGFSRLKQEFAQQELGDLLGMERLWRYANSYRAFAHHNPSYYVIMFGDGLVGFVPPPESRQIAWEAFSVLIAHFASCMEQGLMPAASPNSAARLLWAAMHGVINLELKGYYLTQQQADHLYDAAVRAVLFSLQHPVEATLK